MRLWQLRRHWDALARRDPLYAVLTDPGKEGRRWDKEGFLATGAAEIAADMERISLLAPDFRRGRALDFGCGAGRLTQALAAHFESVTGVDISEQMVDLARNLCDNPRVRFTTGARSDLRAFPSGSFDLVYSRITLQHVAPRYTLRYLPEFVRILAPGGLLIAQVPDRVPAGDPPDRLIFSSWPPTMWMRIKRHLRYHHPGWFPGTPKMQMYAMPRREVAGAIVRAGGTLLQVESPEHGDVTNLVYVARRLQ
ncbi:MAG TPA: class I SAM-dependent methyltransferase [Opitutaceae bacterium]|jgi:SAM-dependent methyltransferase